MDHRKRIYDSYVTAGASAPVPEDLSGLRHRAPYLNRVIWRHFPSDRNARILELGCGHGTFVYLMQQAGYKNVVGVDISHEQVAEAKRLGITGVQQGDVMETLRQLPEASQDVVIAFDLIEHFTKDELLPLVDEVYRVLRMGGKWIIHCPNGESPFGSRVFFGDFTHQTAFTRNSITQLLDASGFSRVSCYEDDVVVHGVKSAVRFLVWRLIRLGLRLWLAAETGDGSNRHILTQNFLTVAVK